MNFQSQLVKGQGYSVI